MNPMDFQLQGSKVKVTVDVIKNLVNRIEDKAILTEASDLPQMFSMERG